MVYGLYKATKNFIDIMLGRHIMNRAVWPKVIGGLYRRIAGAIKKVAGGIFRVIYWFFKKPILYVRMEIFQKQGFTEGLCCVRVEFLDTRGQVVERGELRFQNNQLKIYLEDDEFLGKKLNGVMFLKLFKQNNTNDGGLNMEDFIECLLVLYMKRADIKLISGKSWLARVDMWKCLGYMEADQKEFSLVKKERSLVYSFSKKGLSLISVFEDEECIKWVDHVIFRE